MNDYDGVPELKNGVLKGDIESYKRLRIVYLDYAPESFLFWATVMANKYEYPPAYVDVFRSMTHGYGLYDLTHENFQSLDNTTQSYLKNGLQNAKRKGDNEAIEILSIIE